MLQACASRQVPLGQGSYLSPGGSFVLVIRPGKALPAHVEGLAQILDARCIARSWKAFAGRACEEPEPSRFLELPQRLTTSTSSCRPAPRWEPFEQYGAHLRC